MAIFHQKHPELRKSSGLVVNFNLTAMIKILVCNLPPFIARWVSQRYLDTSYRHMISSYVWRGYHGWPK